MSDDSIEQQVAADDDLLWGCQEISDYIGLSLREVQYLVRKKSCRSAGLAQNYCLLPSAMVARLGRR